MEVNPRVWGSIFQSIAACCNPKENDYAFKLARRYGKPGIFGSDAHLKREIDIGYCEIDATVDFSSIKAGILKGATAVHEICSPKWDTLLSQMVKIFRTGHALPSMKTLKEPSNALRKSNQSR
jgi:predicted metal-dependent phosphoesterase TrpH